MKNYEEIKIFSDKLKKAKDKLNMNHTQFAEFLGYSRETCVKWIHGVFMPGDEKKEIILKKIKDI